MKALLAIVSYIGLPTILIAIGILIVVVIVSLVVSTMFGSGVGLDDDQQKTYDYIVEQANETVDMDNPEQVPYRVPEKLISSVIQLDAMTSEDEYEVIKNMTESLAPVFTYDDSNEWKETKTQVCTDGDCEAWSDITRKDNWVSKLTNVDFWNGYTVRTYTPYTTDWKTKVDVKVEKEYYTEYEERTRIITKKVPYETYLYKKYTEVVTKYVNKPIPMPPYIVVVPIEVEVESCNVFLLIYSSLLRRRLLNFC